MRPLILSALAIVMAGGVCAASAQEQPPLATQVQTFTPEQQAEIAAAEANTALIATRGAWLNGADPVYPDEERALGHHGRAEVRGLLGVDGRLRYATVSRSSRAPVLDQNALVAATAAEYRPARDASGNPIAVMIAVPIWFESYTSREGVGAAMYTCSQFVADMDWWKATWGEEELREHRFYLMIRGLGFIARSGGGGSVTANLESNESYLRRWNQAIETCREHPDRRFAQAMRPEGEYIDRMARQRR
jgi:TonB family protein